MYCQALILTLHHIVTFAIARGLQDVGQRDTPSPANISPNDGVNVDEFGQAVTVDLDYAIYEGFLNITTKLNTFKGIRFADAPTGIYRWQRPRPPSVNRDAILSAKYYAPRCPQSPDGPYEGEPCQDLASSQTLPPQCLNSKNFQEIVIGDEDCLFLNVFAPPNKTNLPVLVWIHGGGYGRGDGGADLAPIINENDQGFVGVAIQYRLGAFGFLSSDEIARFGTPNAGLLDQQHALLWIQDNISKFGGDPRSVTIMGESAGGGSVMLHGIAYDGTLGSRFFQNSIAASPYLPQQYPYNGFVPSQSYYAFASRVGCFDDLPYGNFSTIFTCLQSKDSLVLQQASAIVSGSSLYGIWAFLPVTDGTFVQSAPSAQLLKQRVNGIRLLVGNDANEGPAFTPQDINTEDNLISYIRRVFPLFSEDTIQRTLKAYPASDSPVDPSSPRYASPGDDATNSALNQSSFGTGQQQRANNLYAEATFHCPAYWLAGAYASPDSAINPRMAYKYQYSVPPANHASELNIYFGSPAQRSEYISPQFQRAVQRMIGNFIIHGNPSVPTAEAESSNSAYGNNATRQGKSSALASFPQYTAAMPVQMNLNQTGGVPSTLHQTIIAANVSITVEPGLRNDIRVVNALSWEAGRGSRCEFWRSIAALGPE